jgi:hypothetical protein
VVLPAIGGNVLATHRQRTGRPTRGGDHVHPGTRRRLNIDVLEYLCDVLAKLPTWPSNEAGQLSPLGLENPPAAIRSSTASTLFRLTRPNGLLGRLRSTSLCTAGVTNPRHRGQGTDQTALLQPPLSVLRVAQPPN